jgi:5,10-methylene-tetrahydrofolate dehydrogenase/methenyl tetrahydrofolate cyclohydrolase
VATGTPGVGRRRFKRSGAGGDPAVVGDVDAGAVRAKAAAFTPVPGGVGPVTVAALLDNVATAAERRVRPDVQEGDDR